jgi:3D (Asp-Asp-Asp) domain-containing protein
MTPETFLLLLGFSLAPFSVSAYVDAEGAPPYGFTANMTPTASGICACGPSFPFGVMFYSPETGWLTCQDRGGAITDEHLDLWKQTDEEMQAWGRQEVLMVVVK